MGSWDEQSFADFLDLIRQRVVIARVVTFQNAGSCRDLHERFLLTPADKPWETVDHLASGFSLLVGEDFLAW